MDTLNCQVYSEENRNMWLTYTKPCSTGTVKIMCILTIMIIARTTILTKRIDYPREILHSGDKNTNATMSELNRHMVAYDDATLVDIVQKNYIQPPSVSPYNISRPWIKDPSVGQTQFIDKSTMYLHGWFFVDCGAFDGEHLSNSLFLERYRYWTGILIEPHPHIYQNLVKKRRKAYTLNACLSTKIYPSVETFIVEKKPVLSKVADVRYREKRSQEKYVEVQCFPLYTILLATGQFQVDYFSLDIEGAERGVLDTIPWNKLYIKMLSIEHNKWDGGKQNLTLYMEKRGYTLMTEIKSRTGPDLIFMKT